MKNPIISAVTVLSLAGCGGPALSPPSANVGPSPVLSAPASSPLPVVNIAPAAGWPDGTAPQPPPGFDVGIFASGLDHPRWLHVLPNGDVLVAESNKQPAAPTGVRAAVEKLIMAVAGAEVPSADRITLLRDADGDGTAEIRTVLVDDLTSPFGMAYVSGNLYVANTDALVRFPYELGTVRIDVPGETIVRLPAGAPNRHWTKGLVAGPNGELYVSVGSNSDHGENGREAETARAAIWRIRPSKKKAEVFAVGLRNPVGLDFEPETGELWTVVNERDELGNNLVPDYLTSVRAGANYGWPQIFYGNRLDPRVDWPAGGSVSEVSKPDYALGSHVAPLGLAFAEGALLGSSFSEGAFVGQHGSWNRRPASGYSVVFVPFEDGMPSDVPVDFLSGFRTENGLARGRPAGVAIASDGALLVADDVGNRIWRVFLAK